MIDHSHSELEKSGKGGFFAREAVSGVPWMVVGKLVLFFLYFGVSVLTVNGLGKEKFGVYSLILNISSYMLIICGLGLGSALMRYVPELVARKNRFGLIHFLWKSATLQLLAIAGLSAILLLSCEPLQRLFNAEHVENFRFYLKLSCGLTSILLLKDFVGTVFTSMFNTRIVAILSVIQGIMWFSVLYVWLEIQPEVSVAFFVQIIAVGMVYSIGAVILFRAIQQLPWKTREFGIGKRRALSFSGTVMLSSILRMGMFKYSEIFFLAAVGGTTLAGVYDLGYTLPYTAITFIPLALMPLFTSAFAEAYVRDNSCLGLLISSYYKMLMMVSLPVTVLGICFAPEAYHIIYKGGMDEAGYIASAFCIVLTLPLISMPLSAAIKAKEKVLNMVPMLVLQIVVNLVLDWLLIVEYRMGVWGGIFAVLGTFVLTIPLRLWVIRGIIGGIYFPIGFFLRIISALIVLGAVFRWIATRFNVFHLVEVQWINITLLFITGAVYVGLFLLAARYLRLVREEDIEDFHALEITKLNKLLRFLVR
ncbi:MAG: oligosaccharide flippase family protein [Pontiella sp.]